MFHALSTVSTYLFCERMNASSRHLVAMVKKEEIQLKWGMSNWSARPRLNAARASNNGFVTKR